MKISGIMNQVIENYATCHTGFHIRSTAAKDSLVCNFTTKWIIIPLGAIAGRDNIHMSVQNHTEALIAAHSGQYIRMIRIAGNLFIADTCIRQIFFYKIDHVSLCSHRILTWNTNQVRSQFDKIITSAFCQFPNIISCYVAH